MSIQGEIDRINNNVASTYSALSSFGADIPEAQNTNNLPETVLTIKAVRYDEQTLSDEQKAQARSNIGVTDVMTVTVDGSWNTSHSAAEIIAAKNSGTIVVFNAGILLAEVATAGPDSTDYVDFYTILGAGDQLMKLRVRIVGNKATPTFMNIDAASVGMSALIVTITRGADGAYTTSHSSSEIHEAVKAGKNVYVSWNATYYPCTNSFTNYAEFAMPYVDDGFVYSYFAINGSEVTVHEESTGKALNDAINRLSTEIDSLESKVEENSGGAYPRIDGTEIAEICNRFAYLLYNTDNAESFIYFTDPHVCNPPGYDAENRMLTTLDVLKTYYDATPTSFVVCGGDWLNDVGPQTNRDACYKLGRAASWMRANFDRFYTAIGNHEDNHPYGAAQEDGERYTVETGLSMETIRNLMLPYEKELYYSFDGAHTKFYVMNSSDVENDQQMTDYRWRQVHWLAERLMDDDAANSAIVIHSVLLRPIGEGVFAHLGENLLKLCQAYNNGNTITLNGASYDFSNCTGCVRFMLAGHVHDADCAETHYGIPVVLTRNMLASADSGNGYKPTFDLCLADYDAGVLRMVRVGNYGADRDVLLAIRDFSGDIFTVSLNLTDVTASYTATTARKDEPYENTLTVQKGYTLSSVAITMGGVDITTTAYVNGQISIDSVTGDIVITAVATAIPVNYTNLADPTSADWVEHAVWSTSETAVVDVGTWEADEGYPVVTNFIPVEKYDVLRFEGFDKESGLAGFPPLLVCFDENKERIAHISLKSSDAGTASGFPVSVVTDENGVTAYEILIRGDTNDQFTYNNVCDRVKYVRISALRMVEKEDVIITVNEEIYSSGKTYTNLVPSALSVDGSTVFNSPLGYQNDCTLSDTDVVSTANTKGYVSTGFIKCPDASTKIYIKGADWNDQSYCRIYVYRSIGANNANSQYGNDTNQGMFVVEQLGEKYWRLTQTSDYSEFWYRIALYGNIDASAGEELIITHGEPIE